MTQAGPDDPVVIAIQVDEPGLADRLVALLSDVPGLRLATRSETADFVLTAFEPVVLLPADPRLTPRELEVLALLAEGASNKSIARQLDITVHTAKFHVGSVLDKLDATGRTDAVAHAARLGVIQL